MHNVAVLRYIWKALECKGIVGFGGVEEEEGTLTY